MLADPTHVEGPTRTGSPIRRPLLGYYPLQALDFTAAIRVALDDVPIQTTIGA